MTRHTWFSGRDFIRLKAAILSAVVTYLDMGVLDRSRRMLCFLSPVPDQCMYGWNVLRAVIVVMRWALEPSHHSHIVRGHNQCADVSP